MALEEDEHDVVVVEADVPWRTVVSETLAVSMESAPFSEPAAECDSTLSSGWDRFETFGALKYF